MDCKINKETKTLDFIEGGTTVLVLSFEEAARRGVPFSRDEKDYNTIILDISKVSASRDGGQMLLQCGDNEVARIDLA